MRIRFGSAPGMRAVIATTMVAVAAALAPVIALGQGGGNEPPPLRATIAFRSPPTGRVPVYHPDPSVGPPLSIVVQIENVSDAAVLTTEGFSRTEFWRRLFFTDPQGGTVTDASEANIHRTPQIFQCFSRQRVLLRPTAVPVVPVEVLPAGSRPPEAPPNRFFLEYVVDDARQLWDLSRQGRYTVNARVPALTFVGVDPTSVIADCDQFEGETVVNIGRAGLTGRRAFTVVSNSLEFKIEADSTPPQTTATAAPAPNAAGWNRTPVAVAFSATDQGGSGVDAIHVVTTGSQTGEHRLPGDTGTVAITAEGTTDVRFRAEDNAGNLEGEQGLAVRVDTRPPEPTLSATPAPGIVLLNQAVTVTFAATDPQPGSGLATGFPAATVTPPGGSPQPITSPATLTLDRPGATVIAVEVADVAGHRVSEAVTYTVGYRFVGFLSPLENAACVAGVTPRRVYRLGSTLPVKFQLFDANGQVIGKAVTRISAVRIGAAPLADTVDLGTGAADTGNLFRFDASSGQWIFNLDTSALGQAGSWCVTATLDDQSTQSILIGLR